MYNMDDIRERVILVGVDTEGGETAERSLDELAELAATAGAEVTGRLIQTRECVHPATYIGRGKLIELKELLWETEATGIICDDELSSTQLGNLEEELDCKVLDRTLLILDIFAQRATTREGKIQVELAQLRYRATRLVGMRNSLSRLGGGIGTRGPGESKLETDKRHIRTRIAALSDELKEIEKRRGLMRKRRKKDGVLTAAIVGYTNVGKSTLLNYLTEAGVLAENKLFATLETTSRAIELPDGRSVTLIDTVGLIRRLPHQLVEAFKSTLEEAASADVIIHVCDASADDCEEQAKVTLELLKELGCEGIPVVTVFNKCDKVPYINELDTSGEAVKISAKNGTGIDSLLAAIQKALPENSVRCRLFLPFDKAGLVNTIRQEGRIFSEDYTAEGIVLDALVDIKVYHLVESYKVKNEE